MKAISPELERLTLLFDIWYILEKDYPTITEMYLEEYSDFLDTKDTEYLKETINTLNEAVKLRKEFYA